MDDLERRVRDSLAGQVDRVPPTPTLVDDVVRRGRRARSRRTTALCAVALVGLVTTAVLVTPRGGGDPSVVVATPGPSPSPSASEVNGYPTTPDVALAALPQGPPPAVPLVVGDALVTGGQLVELGREALASAAWRDGVLVVLRGSAGGDELWRWDAGDRSLERIESEQVVGAVVVDPGGTRAGYVVRRPEGTGTRLHRVVRVVPGAQAPLGTPGGPQVSPAPVGGVEGAPEGHPVGFVGRELVVGVAGPEGGDGRVEAWDHERGPTRVVGPGRYRAALATHPGGAVALTTTADSCHEVSDLAVRPGWWSTCDAFPLSFSPDGQLLLVASEVLAVVTARTGAGARTLPVPMGGYASSGWETATTVLVLLRTERGGVQPVRCRADADACERAGPEVPRNGDLPTVVGARPVAG